MAVVTRELDDQKKELDEFKRLHPDATAKQMEGLQQRHDYTQQKRAHLSLGFFALLCCLCVRLAVVGSQRRA